MTEPWLDKRGLAAHLSCSVRSIQTALAQGMPHATIFGRVKFRVSEVEPWLEEHGHLSRADGDAPPPPIPGQLDIDGQTHRAAEGPATLRVEPLTSRPGGAADAPGPDTRSKPHAS